MHIDRGPHAKDSRYVDALVETARSALWLQVALAFHREDITGNVFPDQNWNLILQAKTPSETASAQR